MASLLVWLKLRIRTRGITVNASRARRFAVRLDFIWFRLCHINRKKSHETMNFRLLLSKPSLNHNFELEIAISSMTFKTISMMVIDGFDDSRQRFAVFGISGKCEISFVFYSKYLSKILRCNLILDLINTTMCLIISNIKRYYQFFDRINVLA
jgi:hypothetical protein